MSPNIWMFVRALELDRQLRTQPGAPPRALDPITDAMAQRYAPVPITFT
jgi:hypothetical protein